jgi:uncharacterized protein (DUF362 family)
MPSSMNRREFMKKGAALGLATGAVALVPLWPGDPLFAQEWPTLFVAKGNPQDAVKRVVQAMGGMEKFVKPGNRVVLKPNMSFANRPEDGSNTHPDVVAAVANLCAAAGAKKIIILDYTLADAQLCKEKSGVEAACKNIPKTVIFTPNEQKFFKEVPIPNGKELKKTEVAQVLLDSDVIIGLPTAKSHSATGVSLTMKGWMGVVWDRRYFHKSINCNQGVADLASIIKPHLVIMDAMYALTSNGPGGPGKVDQLDTIVGGTDQVAVDSYTVGLTSWYGKRFTGQQVDHIKRAADMGLGEIDVNKMTIKNV